MPSEISKVRQPPFFLHLDHEQQRRRDKPRPAYHWNMHPGISLAIGIGSDITRLLTLRRPEKDLHNGGVARTWKPRNHARQTRSTAEKQFRISRYAVSSSAEDWTYIVDTKKIVAATNWMRAASYPKSLHNGVPLRASQKDDISP